MAKDKNQNKNRQQRDQQERRSDRTTERDERGGTVTEERVMPSATEVTRKEQKRFGHN